MPKLPILAAAGTRRRWTSTDAQLVLKALAASGLSVNAFATQQGLDAQRLEVVLRSGRVLRISTAIDTPTLRRLVEAFEDDGEC